MKRQWRRVLVVGCIVLGSVGMRLDAVGYPAPSPAPPSPAPTERPLEIETTPIADGLWMLRGRDGNVTVSIGHDGVLIVDTSGAPELELMVAAIEALGGHHVAYVLNTHFHGDHTENNAYFRGRGAEVIAHVQTERNMREDTWSPRTEADLPTITFEDSWSMKFNGQHVEARHVPLAHTNGDIVIRFREANVVVAGDLFVNRGMPYISEGTGGSIDGYLTGQEEVLAWVDEATRVVPGHGPLARRSDIELSRRNLSRMHDRVALLKALHIPFRYVKKLPITADWPGNWREPHVGIKDDHFLEIVYQTLPN